MQNRLTEPFPPELTPTNEVHVYIGTLSSTRKVGQLQSNPKATLGFQDANGRGYIVMKGNAALLEDKDASESKRLQAFCKFILPRDKTRVLFFFGLWARACVVIVPISPIKSRIWAWHSGGDDKLVGNG